MNSLRSRNFYSLKVTRHRVLLSYIHQSQSSSALHSSVTEFICTTFIRHRVHLDYVHQSQSHLHYIHQSQSSVTLQSSVAVFCYPIFSHRVKQTIFILSCIKYLLLPSLLSTLNMLAMAQMRLVTPRVLHLYTTSLKGFIQLKKCFQSLTFS